MNVTSSFRKNSVLIPYKYSANNFISSNQKYPFPLCSNRFWHKSVSTTSIIDAFMQKINLWALFKPRMVESILMCIKLMHVHAHTQPLSHKINRRGHHTYEPRTLIIRVAGSCSALAAAARRPGIPNLCSPRGTTAEQAECRARHPATRLPCWHRLRFCIACGNRECQRVTSRRTVV